MSVREEIEGYLVEVTGLTNNQIRDGLKDSLSGRTAVAPAPRLSPETKTTRPPFEMDIRSNGFQLPESPPKKPSTQIGQGGQVFNTLLEDVIYLDLADDTFKLTDVYTNGRADVA